jgi:hypothetical protein
LHDVCHELYVAENQLSHLCFNSCVRECGSRCEMSENPSRVREKSSISENLVLRRPGDNCLRVRSHYARHSCSILYFLSFWTESIKFVIVKMGTNHQVLAGEGVPGD